MRQILFNPFHKIAGLPALLSGLGIMAVSAVIAYFSHCHFNGIIDAHIGAATPLYVYFFEFLLLWGITFVIFYFSGKLLTKTKIRWIDVAGTTALARYPYFFVALLAFGIPDIDLSDLNHLQNISFSEINLMILTTLLTVVCSVWFIALLYNAFKVSCNLKKEKAVWGFIVAIIIAEVISAVAFHYFYKLF